MHSLEIRCTVHPGKPGKKTEKAHLFLRPIFLKLSWQGQEAVRVGFGFPPASNCIQLQVSFKEEYYSKATVDFFYYYYYTWHIITEKTCL